MMYISHKSRELYDELAQGFNTWDIQSVTAFGDKAHLVNAISQKYVDNFLVLCPILPDYSVSSLEGYPDYRWMNTGLESEQKGIGAQVLLHDWKGLDTVV